MGRKAAAPDAGRREWNAHAKGGWVVLFLWQGSKMTTREVANLCGCTTQNAGKMMNTLESSFPIVLVDGRWQWMEKG